MSRVQLSHNYHAVPGETKYHLWHVYLDLGMHRVFSGELMESAVLAWRDAFNGSSTETRSVVDGSTKGSDRGEEEGRTRGQDHR
jgi:hypothetical protein